MNLYYSPGACSLSPHIVLYESGLPFETILASTKTKQLPDGRDYRSVNPMGYVPLLELDDGTKLTEGPAIVQYIADLVPDRKLAPPAGTLERYQLMAWLNFIATEVHKSFGPLFSPAMPEEAKTQFKEKIVDRLAHVDAALDGKQYLLGDQFTVADAYLFVVTNWAAPMKIDLAGFKHLGAFRQRVSERPAVQKALKAEGLA